MGNKEPKVKSERLPGINEKVMLLWVASQPPFSLRLSKNVLREICDYLVIPQFLVSLDSNMPAVFYFSFKLKEWHMLTPLSQRLPRYVIGHTITFLLDSSLFVCGAGATAHRVGAGVVTVLPLMLTGRYHHSAAFLPIMESVYVFGGGGMTTSASRYHSERFHFPSQKWESLPTLCRPRIGVNACMHRGLLYFCGGDAGGTVETFNWRNNEFSLLESVALPLMGEPCTSVIVADTCFCFGEKVAFQWDVHSKRVQKTRQREHCEVKSACPPLVWQGVVYIVDAKMCIAFGISTGKVVGKYPKS